MTSSYQSKLYDFCRPGAALPVLPKETEDEIKDGLNELLKEFRKQTFDFSEYICETDKFFSAREEELNSPTDGARKSAQKIKLSLTEFKNDLFDRDKEANGYLKKFEGVYWSSAHTRDFEIDYAHGIAAVYDQKLVRDDFIRNAQHLVRKIDETSNLHQRNEAADQREFRIWAVGFIVAASSAVAALIEQNYPLAVCAAGTAGIVCLLKPPKRPECEKLEKPEMKIA